VIQVDTSANTDLPKEVVGKQPVYNTLILKRPDSVFVINLDQLQGSKSAVLFTMDKSAPDAAFRNMKRKVGEDTFLGRKCEIFDVGGAKIWYWRGIALKKVLLPDQLYEIATSIDERYIIKANEFEVPKNVRMQ